MSTRKCVQEYFANARIAHKEELHQQPDPVLNEEIFERVEQPIEPGSVQEFFANALIAHKEHAEKIQEEEEYWEREQKEYWDREREDSDHGLYDVDIYSDEYERKLEKQYALEEKLKSLEEIRKQLTFTVDKSGEIHLEKRDKNNKNLHITRISKSQH